MKIILFLARYVWLIRIAVETIEVASDGFTGEEKKAAVIEVISGFAKSFGLTVDGKFMEMLGVVIDIIVEILNKFGGWKKDAPA
jgi:hypothetical protein